MKQPSESQDPVQYFPTVLSKFQSGALFTKSNLLSTLGKSQNSPEPLKTLHQSLASLKSFKQFLLKFYEDACFDSNKSQIANLNIEYLHSLFEFVYNKGGWSVANGREYWKVLARDEEFKVLKGVREDYQEFLWKMEKKYGIEGRVLGTDGFLGLTPSLMKSAEFFRPFEIECELNSELISKIFQKPIFVIPCFSNHILNLPILHQVQVPPTSFTQVIPLSQYPICFQDLNSNLLSSIHWSSDSNLLKYAPASSLSTPNLIFLKNNPYHFGGKSFLSTNSIFLTLNGEVDYYIISDSFIENLKNSVSSIDKKDIFESNWTPDENFLLSNQIEFTYIKSYPGDAVFAQTNSFFWLVSKDAVLLNWVLLPIVRIEAVCTSYLSSIDQFHQFNLPLLAVEYLNRTLGSVDNIILNSLKNVILESIDDESWTGNYEQEKIEFSMCLECKKDLFWRYGTCKVCLDSGLKAGFCLKCASLHKCCSIESVQKYSSVEFDMFLSRMDTSEATKPQENLKKILVSEPVGLTTIKFNPRESLKYELALEKESESLKVIDSDPIPQNSNLPDDSNKRSITKKQKTGEGSTEVIILEIKKEYIKEQVNKRSKRNTLKNFENVKRRELADGKKLLLEVDN